MPNIHQRLTAARRAAWLCMVGALVHSTGCASANGARAGQAQIFTPAFPLGPSDALPLTSLPALSTYAWLDPSELFVNVTPTQDSFARVGAYDELRETTSAVLRANGWRETTPDSASYYLSVVDAMYLGMKTEMVPDPRSERPVPLVCPTRSREQRQVCDEPPPPYYPRVAREVPVQEHRVTFAVRRAHDSAMHWMIVDHSRLNTIALMTVQLLRAHEP